MWLLMPALGRVVEGCLASFGDLFRAFSNEGAATVGKDEEDEDVRVLEKGIQKLDWGMQKPRAKSFGSIYLGLK